MKEDILKYINKITKKATMPKRILEHFVLMGTSTVSDIAKNIDVSLPTAAAALNDLMVHGLVKEVGKKETSTGRIPMLYDLNPKAGYFIGANPEMTHLALTATDFCGHPIVDKTSVPYHYENTVDNLEQMGQILNQFIDSLPVKREDILNVCVNIAERVNAHEGKTYTIFSFNDEPLTDRISKMIDLPVCIENDTRSMTYAEFIKGSCRGLKDVIFVNVCWGIGIGIIIDGKLYYGKSGYSGEFGHNPAYNNNIICHCGKIGCVETETSGRALKRKLTEALLQGKQSVLSDKVVNRHEELTFKDVLDAIEKEDVLSLATLQQVADELGKQLASMINVFNPEMLVIGGELSVTGDYLTLPVRMGIKRYSLNIMNEDSKVVTSTLTDKAGVLGACLMARYRLICK